MPYARNADLPDGVKSILPDAAQTIWRNVFNSQEDRGLSEERAIASAWGALKNQGWEKGDDGQWHRMAKAWKVLKADAKRQMVFGWANVSLTAANDLIEDSHGDSIELEDLEQAAYRFVLYERTANEMHRGGVQGNLIESVMITPEKLAAWGLPEDALQKGWWLGFHIPDPVVFAKVEQGDYTMFSIEGTATPEEDE